MPEGLDCDGHQCGWSPPAEGDERGVSIYLYHMLCYIILLYVFLKCTMYESVSKLMDPQTLAPKTLGFHGASKGNTRSVPPTSLTSGAPVLPFSGASDCCVGPLAHKGHGRPAAAGLPWDDSLEVGGKTSAQSHRHRLRTTKTMKTRPESL